MCAIQMAAAFLLNDISAFVDICHFIRNNHHNYRNINNAAIL